MYFLAALNETTEQYPKYNTKNREKNKLGMQLMHQILHYYKCNFF